MALSNSHYSKLSSLHFGLINLNHSRPATALLNQDILANHLDLVCVTEPYYTDMGVANFTLSFKIVAIKTKPRAAIIIINNDINYTIIAEYILAIFIIITIII